VSKTILVIGAGDGAWSAGSLARTIALLLSAHGVAVVVLGSEERAVGEVVGEMVYGGGRARHAVGDAHASEHLGAAIDKARDVFGALDAIVACTDKPTEVMGALGPALGARAIACDAVFLPCARAPEAGSTPGARRVEKLAEHVAALLTYGSATTTFKMF